MNNSYDISDRYESEFDRQGGQSPYSESERYNAGDKL